MTSSDSAPQADRPRHSGLPEIAHMEGLCPRCRKQSSFEMVGEHPLGFGKAQFTDSLAGRTTGVEERVGVLHCRNCRQRVLVVEKAKYGKQLFSGATNMPEIRPVEWRGVHWWPPVRSSIHKAVPEAIGLALQEAETTLAANCYRASSIMARHALEAVVAHQGGSGKSLADGLKSLVSANKLQANLADWATEVRLVGNAGAHNPLAPVPREDAQDLVSFMHALVEYLYVLPHDLDERRKRKPGA